MENSAQTQISESEMLQKIMEKVSAMEIQTNEILLKYRSKATANKSTNEVKMATSSCGKGWVLRKQGKSPSDANYREVICKKPDFEIDSEKVYKLSEDETEILEVIGDKVPRTVAKNLAAAEKLAQKLRSDKSKVPSQVTKSKPSEEVKAEIKEAEEILNDLLG